MDPVDIWPVLGLQVRTPRLTLRPPGLDLTFALAELAAAGIHDPAEMPFLRAWTDTPPPEQQRESVRRLLGRWAEFRPGSWTLALAVFEGETLVGMQSVKTEGFPVLRQFSTGSWLGRAFQGRGIGREMRAAVLHLGFAGLGATRALTDAFVDNPASLAVTRALGYEPNGRDRIVRRGAPVEVLRFTMERADWETIRRDDIELDGVDDRLLAFLGLGAA
jgi:RimJ/RimL family protein N-acetyltransferase